jgi:hypothetical protein
MDDFFEFMFTPRGKALINAMACAIFGVQIWISLSRQRIDLGSIPPKIRKSDNPRAFWAVIGLYGVIVVWTGTAAAMNFL